MILPVAVSSLNNTNELLHYNNQLTVVKQCFTNTAAKQTMGVTTANLNLRNLWGVGDITDMSK